MACPDLPLKLYCGILQSPPPTTVVLLAFEGNLKSYILDVIPSAQDSHMRFGPQNKPALRTLLRVLSLVDTCV